MYDAIIYPVDENKNQRNIYRIGTFLKYYTSENHKRLFEDNLVTKFNKYIYNEDVDVSIERLKKLDLDYLLVDLNAATIDKDPRGLLTQRYEKLLTTFTSDKLELIESDSMCLKIALEKYRQDKNMTEYLILAGGNHNSYIEDEIVSRSQKITACIGFVYNLMQTGGIDEGNYSYLV